MPADEPDVTSTPESEKPDTPAASAQKMKVVKVNSYVNLRESAFAKSESLMQIPKDAVVEYIGEQDGDFHKVIYLDMTGYILSAYLNNISE